MSFKRIIKNPIFLILLGAALGFVYYYYIGCKSGTCSITNSPLKMVIFGGLIGFLLTPEKRKEKSSEE